MFSKHIIAAGIMAAVSVLPAQQVTAGSNGLAGAIIGGIIGGAIVNSTQRQRTTTRRTTTRRSSATRAANRETQTALNYFGFPAGTPDGALGRRSRAAISSYQVYLGYPSTGYLLPYERDFLVNSYNRALVGGATTSELIAQSNDGVRGLLVAYRDQQAGGTTFAGRSIGGLPQEVSASVFEIAKSSDPSAQQLIQRSGFVQLADINNDGQTDYILDTSVTGSAFWCNAQNCAVRVFASTPDGYQRNDFQAFNVVPAMFTCQRGNCTKSNAPTTQMAVAPVIPQATLPQTQQAALPVPTAQPAVRSLVPAAAPLALPNFLGAQASSVSLASHCNQVSLLTNSNGGFVTLATMSDPGFALNEQFCLARTYAIAKGEELVANLAGVTNAQLEQQCGAFGPAMKSHVTALSLKPRAQVVQDVSGFILTTGMTPEQLAGTAKICLSVGYRTDNLDVALGSAMLLTVLGQQAYGELLGHHLTQGFGASKRPDLALAWYEDALDAVDNGAEMVFAPGNPDRNLLIREAAFPLVAHDQAGVVPAALPKVPAPALPVFSLTSGATE